MNADLSFWNDTPTKQAIQDFVAKVTDRDNPAYVPPEERIAVFDNDGTLWCEAPVQVQVDFILRRLAAMAEKEPSLRRQQPWQAAYEQDKVWFSDAMTKHYHGDDSQATVLLGGIIKAFSAMTVEAFGKMAADFIHQTRHPSLGVPYMEVTFQPMVELLRYLEAYDFTNYIISGGGRDFIRPVTQTLYGIPPERVIGSAVKLGFQADGQDATIVRQAGLDVINDGPAKAILIWDRIGRRPILAAGNSNGDIPMLQYTAANPQPSLCLLVNHDDAGREFDYTAGAENALKTAQERGWVVASVKQDWRTVFAVQTH
ncbi:MAG: haloacid dehalogenase-like hydrolase [Anaerolineae bacterium]|nr:haloacid dehalogenase-like hydrolase [Anaerolineae bacterium]MCB9106379.1 haloacid dehalogenase-like hydrolase [Anaerolineales bacterium]